MFNIIFSTLEWTKNNQNYLLNVYLEWGANLSKIQIANQ